MHTAFLIYDRMTALDFVSVFDALTRLKTMNLLPGYDWDVCSYTDTVTTDKGLRLTPDVVAPSLAVYDLLIVPGGYGAKDLSEDKRFIDWLRMGSVCGLTASVCTGALLLGAAGFLTGKKATTHRSAFDDLKPYCAEVVDERVVDEGDVVTARGVTAGIDLGLHLAERLAGPEARARIATQMDYPA